MSGDAYLLAPRPRMRIGSGPGVGEDDGMSALMQVGSVGLWGCRGERERVRVFLELECLSFFL